MCGGCTLAPVIYLPSATLEANEQVRRSADVVRLCVSAKVARCKIKKKLVLCERCDWLWRGKAGRGVGATFSQFSSRLRHQKQPPEFRVWGCNPGGTFNNPRGCN